MPCTNLPSCQIACGQKPICASEPCPARAFGSSHFVRTSSFAQRAPVLLCFRANRPITIVLAAAKSLCRILQENCSEQSSDVQ
jgi:hypothetical protein